MRTRSRLTSTVVLVLAALLGGFLQLPTAAHAADPPTGESAVPSFTDVPPGRVFYDEITWLATQGITTGWPDGTFRPTRPVLRDQMAAFIYRKAGSPDFTPPAVSPFTDISPSRVFYKEITWLASTGITTGWPDGTFRPTRQVLRDQMAAFLYRYDVAFNPPTCGDAEWTGEYFANKELTGAPKAVRCDEKVDFSWGEGAPAGVPVGADGFSVRWTTTQNFSAGSYVFDALSDDGMRVKVDGQLLIDGWKDQPRTAYAATTSLSAGQHTVVVEFYDATEAARAKLDWTLLANPSADCSQGSIVSVVAHPDDDLLFMNPSILRGIQAGKCVRTVVLTAGDAGDTVDFAEYFLSREQGQRAAYANMAGVANEWTLSNADTSGTRWIRAATNASNPKVSLVTLRLPDGNFDGSGFDRTGFVGLSQLQNGTISSLSAVDGSASYTASELVGVIRSLIAGYDTIQSQDYLTDAADEHRDHIATSRFTKEAIDAAGLADRVTGFVGYRTQTLPENVTGADLDAKRNAWYAYSAFDRNVDCGGPANCAEPYATWQSREYSFGPSGPSAAWDAPNPTVLVGQTTELTYTCSQGSTASITPGLPEWLTAGSGSSVTASPQAVASAQVELTCTDVVGRTASASTVVTAS